MYESDKTGKQVDAGATLATNPTMFTIKTTTANPSPHDLILNSWEDVVFVDINSTTHGDFEYTNGLLYYRGDDILEMSIQIGTSVFCDTINAEVYLGQWKNGLIDYGAISISKAESNVSIVPFGMLPPFTMEKDDYLNLRISSDKTCHVDLYHMSIEITTKKIYV